MPVHHSTNLFSMSKPLNVYFDERAFAQIGNYRGDKTFFTLAVDEASADYCVKMTDTETEITGGPVAPINVAPDYIIGTMWVLLTCFRIKCIHELAQTYSKCSKSVLRLRTQRNNKMRLQFAQARDIWNLKNFRSVRFEVENLTSKPLFFYLVNIDAYGSMSLLKTEKAQKWETVYFTEGDVCGFWECKADKTFPHNIETFFVIAATEKLPFGDRLDQESFDQAINPTRAQYKQLPMNPTLDLHLQLDDIVEIHTVKFDISTHCEVKRVTDIFTVPENATVSVYDRGIQNVVAMKEDEFKNTMKDIDQSRFKKQTEQTGLTMETAIENLRARFYRPPTPQEVLPGKPFKLRSPKQ